MVMEAQDTQIKPGYKLTEVGVIPEEWEVTQLGEVADIKTGPFGSALHEKDYVDDGTPIITVEHLGELGVVYENVPMVSENDRKRLKAYSLLEGDIVFSRVGSVDRNSLVKEKESGWLFSGRLLRIRLKHQSVDPAFLSYYFNQEPTKQRIRSVAVGQTMASLNTQILKSISIAFPPTQSEQHAIATALSDIDALITSLDKLIAKKRDIKQATMQQLLTGKTRLPGFSKEQKQAYKQTEIGAIPEDWGISLVEEIANVTTGNRDTQDRIEAGAYPFFVRSQTIERINSYSYDGEAVLTAGDGVGVGKVFHYINGKFDFHQRVYMIYNFKNFDGYFFYLYFSNNFYKEATKYNAKNSVDSVRREMVTGMLIPHPSLPEQHAIATVLSDMDAEIVALEQKREKTRMLKQGMMQELLTGKTRLV